MFDWHTADHMIDAIKRAITVFKNKEDYHRIRENAFNAVIDCADVTRAYAKEFYRMWNKNFLDK